MQTAHATSHNPSHSQLDMPLVTTWHCKLLSSSLSMYTPSPTRQTLITRLSFLAQNKRQQSLGLNPDCPD